jgi:hypothetical protein
MSPITVSCSAHWEAAAQRCGYICALYTAQSGESLFDSRQRQELYFSEADRPALGHISTLQHYDILKECIRRVRAMRHGAEHLQCC